MNMKENSEYRSLARMSLSGKWAFGAIASIVYFIIVCVPSEFVNSASDTQFGHLWGLFMYPLSWGYGVLWLALARDENVDYGMLFDGFKDYLRIFLTLLLVQIHNTLDVVAYHTRYSEVLFLQHDPLYTQRQPGDEVRRSH